MSKSVKTTKSTGTRKSGSGIAINEDLDVKASKFIDEKLPEFFGVKAAHHQAAVINGRNPKSLPKDSELWLYSKISTQRKNLIERGRGLWDVVGEVSLEKSHAETVKREQRLRSPTKSPNRSRSSSAHNSDMEEEDGYADGNRQLRKGSELENPQSRSQNPPRNAPFQHAAATSIHMTGQIKAAMQNKASSLDLRVNFKTKAPVAYGNTFLIVNYNDEVMYMHNISKEGETPIYELRTKPLSKVESTDRVKFKALDLNNPSNPKAIRFGDNVWFQCVVDEDNTNIMAGFVMTSKIFEPPNLQSVRIDYRSIPEEGGDAATSANNVNGNNNNNANNNGKSPAGKKTNRRRSVANNVASTSSLPSLYAASGGNNAESANAAATRQQSAPSSLLNNGHNASTTADKEHDGNVSSSTSITEELLHTHHTEKVAMALGVLGAKKEVPQSEEDAKIAKICGYLQVNRIADNPRLFEGQPPPENANALKNSMRYNTKQTMVLGKWTFNDALRNDQRADPDAKKHGAHHSSNGKQDGKKGRHDDPDDPSSTSGNMAALARSGILTSLTPIIIQQDAYCLSFAPPTEITKWPLTSFDILKKNVKQRPSAMPSSSKGGGSSSSNNSSGSGTNALSMSSMANLVAQQSMSSSTPFLPAMSSTNNKGGRRSLSPSFASTSSSINNGSNNMDLGGNSSGNNNANSPHSKANLSFTTANSTAQYIEELNTRYIKHLEHLKKGGILPNRLESVIIKEKAVGNGSLEFGDDARSSSGYRSGHGHDSQNQEFTNYGILRRIVSRKAPYDFAVDRRCVWKLCVFEEFTDNFLELSSKEKHAKEVMETATMTLKISKLNREGSTVHIQRDKVNDLPALCGGEKFPRTLREITFRTNQKAEQEYLRARRIREYKLSQYFTAMIPQVLEKEENNAMYRPGTASTIDTISSADDEEEEYETEGDDSTKDSNNNNDKNKASKKHFQRTGSQKSISSVHRRQHRRRQKRKSKDSKSASTLLFLTEAEQAALTGDEDDNGDYTGSSSANHNSSPLGDHLKSLEGQSSDGSPHSPPKFQTTTNNNSSNNNNNNNNNRSPNNSAKKSRYYDNGMMEVKESIHHAVRTMKSISAAEVEEHNTNNKSNDLLIASLHLGNPRHKSLAVQDALAQAKAGSPRGLLLSSAKSGSNASTPTNHAQRLLRPSSSSSQQQHHHSPLSRPDSASSTNDNVMMSSHSSGVHHHNNNNNNNNNNNMGSHHHSPPKQQQSGHSFHSNHSNNNNNGNNHHRHSNNNSHHGHSSHHKLSEEIQLVFNTKVKVPNKEEMVLTNTDKVQHFNDFSSGEQIMSLHRTMNFYNKLANIRSEQALLAEKNAASLVASKPLLGSSASTSALPSSSSSSSGTALSNNNNNNTNTINGSSDHVSAGGMMTLQRRQSTHHHHHSTAALSGNSNSTTASSSGGFGLRKMTIHHPVHHTHSSHHHNHSHHDANMANNTSLIAGGSSGSSASASNMNNSGSNSSSNANNAAAAAAAATMSSNRKVVPLSAQVLAKLEKLQLEDANIEAALNYKQSLDRNPMNDIEHRNYSHS